MKQLKNLLEPKKILRNHNYLLYLACLFLFVLPVVVQNEFFRYYLILFCLTATIAVAWNTLASCGQFSLGNAAFFGIGAYSSTLMFIRWGVSPWVGMFVAGGIASLSSIFIGSITFRLRNVYFVMGTFAFAETMKHIFINLPELTGGSIGLFIPPGDSLVNFQFSSKMPYYYYILSLTLLCAFVSNRLFRSKIGYCLKAIANDEEAAASLGVHILKYKLIALAICAFFTGIAGAFYSEYILYIEPFETFGFNNSFKPVLASVVGGLGTVPGAILGAFVIVTLEEVVRGIMGQLVGATLGVLNILLIGILFIIILIFLPGGIYSLFKGRRSSRTK